jgi:uncharacterized membrane protein
MDKEKETKAFVDGREVEAEIIEDNGQGDGSVNSFNEHARYETKSVFGSLRMKAPLISAGIVFVLLFVVIITLFVWALPVLLPIILIGIILKMLARR